MVTREQIEKHIAAMDALLERIHAAQRDGVEYAITREDYNLLSADRSFYRELCSNNVSMFEALAFYADSSNYDVSLNIGQAFVDKGVKAWQARFGWDDA